MSDFATYDTTNDPAGPEKPRVFGLKILEDINILKRGALSDTISVPVPGMLKAYAVGNDIHFKVVLPDNSEVEALAGIYKLRENLLCEKKALIQPILEAVATGSLLALDPANVGVLQYDSTRDKIVVGGDTRRNYVGVYNVDGGDYVRVRCDLDTDGLASPAGTLNKNGELGWLMDDVNDELRVRSRPVPTGWRGVQDAKLEVLVALNQAESIGNTVDMQMDYTTALIGSGGHGGATTNKPQVQPTMAAGVADGDVQRVLIDLTYNDANNPIAADRKLVGVLKRNGLTDVGGVVVLQANLLVPVVDGVHYQT